MLSFFNLFFFLFFFFFFFLRVSTAVPSQRISRSISTTLPGARYWVIYCHMVRYFLPCARWTVRSTINLTDRSNRVHAENFQDTRARLSASSININIAVLKPPHFRSFIFSQQTPTAQINTCISRCSNLCPINNWKFLFSEFVLFPQKKVAEKFGTFFAFQAKFSFFFFFFHRNKIVKRNAASIPRKNDTTSEMFI